MKYYILFFASRRLNFAPLLNDLAQVDLAESDVNLADLVVARETVEVVDGKYQRLAAYITVR